MSVSPAASPRLLSVSPDPGADPEEPHEPQDEPQDEPQARPPSPAVSGTFEEFLGSQDDEPEVTAEQAVTAEDCGKVPARRPAPSQHSSVRLSRAPRPVLLTELTQPHEDGEDEEAEEEEEEGRRIVLGLEGEDEFDDDDDSDVMGGGVDIEQDNGYDTDLDIKDGDWLYPQEEFDSTGLKTYIKECNRLGVIPVSYFQRHVHDTRFVMRHHGLGPRGAKAIAKPLEANAVIEQLDLQGNHICAGGTRYLCKVLRENIYISELNLSENALGSRGCRAVCNMMAENSHIVHLDLSGNHFSDNDCEFFHSMLQQNSSLLRLNLSHNDFEGEGLFCFRDALLQNENLKHLDLSWNHIRLRGATAIAELVRDNYGLKSLNVAMNGLADSGAAQLGNALKSNQCLQELDVTSNRITQLGAADMARGLSINDVLHTLKIGRNSLTEDGAMSLLNAVEKNDASDMQLLDLTDVIVSEEFDALHKRLDEERGKQLRVIHGGVYYSSKHSVTRPRARHHDPLTAFDNDPMTKLKKYAQDKHLRLVDVFKYFDKDTSWKLDRAEFMRGIKVAGLDISEKDIDELITRLDLDGDGQIDYGLVADTVGVQVDEHGE